MKICIKNLLQENLPTKMKIRRINKTRCFTTSKEESLNNKHDKMNLCG